MKRDDEQKNHTGLIIILVVGLLSLSVCCLGFAFFFGLGV